MGPIAPPPVFADTGRHGEPRPARLARTGRASVGPVTPPPVIANRGPQVESGPTRTSEVSMGPIAPPPVLRTRVAHGESRLARTGGAPMGPFAPPSDFAIRVATANRGRRGQVGRQWGRSRSRLRGPASCRRTLTLRLPVLATARSSFATPLKSPAVTGGDRRRSGIRVNMRLVSSTSGPVHGRIGVTTFDDAEGRLTPTALVALRKGVAGTVGEARHCCQRRAGGIRGKASGAVVAAPLLALPSAGGPTGDQLGGSCSERSPPK